MRSEIRRHGGVIYLYDCYNANPASVKAALDVLVELDPKRRTIAVLGDMLELGPQGISISSGDRSLCGTEACQPSDCLRNLWFL